MRRHIWTSTTRSDISLRQSRGPAPREGYFFASEIAEFSPASSSKAKGCGVFVQVLVRDNNVDQALRALKKKMQREGIFREMNMRDYYEKPLEKRAREKA